MRVLASRVCVLSAISAFRVALANPYFTGIPDGGFGASSIVGCGGATVSVVPAVENERSTISSPWPTHKWWSSALWNRCVVQTTATSATVSDGKVISGGGLGSISSVTMAVKVISNSTTPGMSANAFSAVSDRYHLAISYPPKFATVEKEPAAAATVADQKFCVLRNGTFGGGPGAADVSTYAPASSTPMFPHPWSMQATPTSLDLTAAAAENLALFNNDGFLKAYKFIFAPFDFSLSSGVVPASSSGFVVADESDFHATLKWEDLGMTATFGRGLAFVQASVTGNGGMNMQFQGHITIWETKSNCMGVTLQTYRGPSVLRYFGVYFDNNVNFIQSSTVNVLTGAPLQNLLFTTTSGNVVTLRIVSLNEKSTDRLASLQKVSSNQVTGGTVTSRYIPNDGVVEVSYELTTTTGSDVLLALFPHQYKNVVDDNKLDLDFTYDTPRGSLVTLTASSYKLRFPYMGILPGIPHVAPNQTDELNKYIDEFMNIPPTLRLPLDADSYWAGKAFGKVADFIMVAASLSRKDIVTQLLGELKTLLGDWLSYDGASDARYFYYDVHVGSLIGYPASYGSDQELNDHHFHYGYFIKAAAIIALMDTDSSWVDSHSEMVELLIRDASNWDRSDARFPYNRQFDPIGGHHYASGHAAFGSGNNQESSSEAMNYNAALILWGSTVGKMDIRDFGIYMYALEASAIHQYWFNIDGDTFPPQFNSPYSSLLWDDGGSYEIFWGPPHPEELLGINLLPVAGHSMYLGYYPEVMQKYYDYMVKQNGGSPEQMWQDVIWKWQSMYDATSALNTFHKTDQYAIEAGTTEAHTFHWIINWLELGQIDNNFYADVPLYGSFSNGYRVAFNPSSQTLIVYWSDGMKQSVAPRSFGVTTKGDVVNPPPPTSTTLPSVSPSGTSSTPESMSTSTSSTTTPFATTPSTTVMSTSDVPMPTSTLTLQSSSTSTTFPLTASSSSAETTLTVITTATATTTSIVMQTPTPSQIPSGIRRIISQDGACGFDGILTLVACPDDACCSQYGWCGYDESFCGTGCQLSYGTCQVGAIPPPPPPPPPPPQTNTQTVIGTSTQPAQPSLFPSVDLNNLPISQNGECGEQNSGGNGAKVYKCSAGNCCSQYGWCGAADSHCGAGCQPAFGHCA